MLGIFFKEEFIFSCNFSSCENRLYSTLAFSALFLYVFATLHVRKKCRNFQQIDSSMSPKYSLTLYMWGNNYIFNVIFCQIIVLLCRQFKLLTMGLLASLLNNHETKNRASPFPFLIIYEIRRGIRFKFWNHLAFKIGIK